MAHFTPPFYELEISREIDIFRFHPFLLLLSSLSFCILEMCSKTRMQVFRTRKSRQRVSRVCQWPMQKTLKYLLLHSSLWYKCPLVFVKLLELFLWGPTGFPEAALSTATVKLHMSTSFVFAIFMVCFHGWLEHWASFFSRPKIWVACPIHFLRD